MIIMLTSASNSGSFLSWIMADMLVKLSTMMAIVPCEEIRVGSYPLMTWKHLEKRKEVTDISGVKCKVR